MFIHITSSEGILSWIPLYTLCLCPQVRPRPRHLLVRLHRRVGREPGERDPADGPLPPPRRHHGPALKHPHLTASTEGLRENPTWSSASCLGQAVRTGSKSNRTRGEDGRWSVVGGRWSVVVVETRLCLCKPSNPLSRVVYWWRHSVEVVSSRWRSLTLRSAQMAAPGLTSVTNAEEQEMMWFV